MGASRRTGNEEEGPSQRSMRRPGGIKDQTTKERREGRLGQTDGEATKRMGRRKGACDGPGGSKTKKKKEVPDAKQ